MSSLPSSPESDTQTPSSSTLQPPPPSSAILSPPDSQHRTTTTMPISPTGLSGANSNGKRPINTISNGPEEDITLPSLQASSSSLSSSQPLNGSNVSSSRTRTAQGQPHPPSDFPPKVHERSGYTWDREEDAPGYAWLNKKAVEEYHRALEGMAGREREGVVVGARYPDPFEMVEKERAVKESMK